MASRALGGGLASRSLATTRKKYLPSARMSPSKVMEFSCMPLLQQHPLGLVFAAEVDGVDQAVAIGIFGRQVRVICCAAARGSVCVGVPADAVDGIAAVADRHAVGGRTTELAAFAACVAGAACVMTLMLFTTGGEFCGR